VANFIDKLVVGVNKGVVSVGANSKALVEKAKINTFIGNLEKQRSQLLLDLGQKVFEAHQKSDEIIMDDALSNLIAEVGRCNATIAQQHEQLRLIDEEVKRATDAATQVTAQHVAARDTGGGTCGCGYVNPPENKFCVGCGKTLEKMVADIPPENTSACKCGRANAMGAKFCEKCGNAL
jgi:hypothetical protein